MPIQVRKVEPPDDEELLEQWTRDDGDDLGGVEALLPDDHPWQVIVGMAEFAREDPLETQLDEAVYEALTRVPGVSRVAREDTEVWLAWGTPNGGELVRAASEAIDPLVPAVRTHQQQDHHGGRRKPPPVGARDRQWGPIVACAGLAVIGVVLLVSGLLSGDGGTALLGAAAVGFFGGGAVVLLRV